MIVSGALFVLVGADSSAEAARLDPSFGNNGTVITKSGTPVIGAGVTNIWTGNAWDIAEDSQGRLVAGGGAADDLMVARYLSDGSPDSSFGTNGVSIFHPIAWTGDPNYGKAEVRALDVLPNGKVLLAIKDLTMHVWGIHGSYFEMIRLLPDGTPDPVFGNPEVRGDNWEGSPGWLDDSQMYPRDLVALPGGGFLVSGRAEGIKGVDSVGAQKHWAFAGKWNSDSRRVKTFGNRGKGVFRFGSSKYPRWNEFQEMKRLPSSGKILVGGYFRNQFLVGRLTSNGLWDRTFGASKRGFTIVTKRQHGKLCRCEVGMGIDIDKRGRIVLGGYSGPTGDRLADQRVMNLLRLTPNGKLDRSFGHRGRVSIDVGDYISVRDVAVHPSGRIFLSAYLGVKNLSKFAVFGFKANGKVDHSFFRNGRYVVKIGDTSTAEEMLIDSRKRLVVSGGTNRNSDASFVIKRFIVNR